MKRIETVLGGALVLAVLSGCGGGGGINVREMVGVDKNPPDQFAVIRNRPLEMPPGIETLPPPQPGARSRATIDPVAEARAALGAAPVPASAGTTGPSAAERALIASAGAAPADIRAVTAQEAAASGERGYLLDGLFPDLQRRRQVRTGDVLDPLEELKRAREEAPLIAAAAPSGAPAIIPAAPAPVAVTTPQPVIIEAAPTAILPPPVYVEDLPAATAPAVSGPFPE